MYSLKTIGKIRNKWLNKLMQNFPSKTSAPSRVIIGPRNQIFLSSFLKISKTRVLWLADEPKFDSALKTLSMASDKIIAPNQFTQAKYLKIGISDDKTQLLYPACKIEYVEKKDNRPITIGCDGETETDNGLSSIFKSLASVKEILGEFRLIIGGEIPEKNKIEWLAGELGIKKMAQFAPSKNQIWTRDIDIYINPQNQSMPAPVSLIQAMSFGKPIIATDNLANREFLKPNENAILVKEKNPEMMCQAIINLNRDQEWAKRQGYNNYKFAQEKFSETLFRGTLQKIFNE